MGRMDDAGVGGEWSFGAEFLGSSDILWKVSGSLYRVLLINRLVERYPVPVVLEHPALSQPPSG